MGWLFKKFNLKWVGYLDKGENWIAHLVTSPSLTSLFSISLMALISVLPVHIPDAHLTLSNSSSVNDLVLKQSEQIWLKAQMIVTFTLIHIQHKLNKAIKKGQLLWG